MKRRQKLFDVQLRLSQDTRERPDFQLSPLRHDACQRTALKDDVASSLPNLGKAESFQCADRFSTAKPRQPRHDRSR